MDGTAVDFSAVPDGFLIDWLTLRVPLDLVPDSALDKVMGQDTGLVVCTDHTGEELWRKLHFDLDRLRSDSQGLFFQVHSDGKTQFLTVGGSPAALTSGENLFGSFDLAECAQVVRRRAMAVLSCFLPSLDRWQCRRVDVTANYLLPDAGTVKTALKGLLVTEGARRRPSSDNKGGDTVYWNVNSDLVKGKAYHKGPQLRHLMKRGKAIPLTDEEISLTDRLIRFEHTLGSRWFRRLEDKTKDAAAWLQLAASDLYRSFTDFFGRLIGGEAEVHTMGSAETINKIQSRSAVTENQARAAYNTYRNIKADGFEHVQGYMAKRTFLRHLKLLREAGFVESDLQAGNVIPINKVRLVLCQPVASWGALRAAA